MPFNPASPLARLMAAPMRPGVVVWIGLRPARRTEVLTPDIVRLEPGLGAVGDRWQGNARNGKGTRQLTIMTAEDLAAIASYMGVDTVSPAALRRNLVVRGVNLRAVKDAPFRIGEALIEITGECHPCSRMEETLGLGGYNAVRGHGGMTARVLEGGAVRIGDAVDR